MHRLLLLVVMVSFSSGQRARFDKYRVYRLTPRSATQLHFLNAVDSRPDGLVFLTSPGGLGHPVDVMVAPHQQPGFHQLLHDSTIDHRVTIDNVQRLVDAGDSVVRRSESYGWDSYHTLNKTWSWLDSVASSYSGLASTFDAGRSYEGRPLKGVRVSFRSGNPAVFIEAGAHAREWVSVTTATYLLHQLLTSDNSSLREVARSFDWYILPSANPDGYHYSYTKDRMWRKTRDPGPNNGCYGTDLNRNWDYHWGDAGSSDNPCSGHYAGSAPFSAVEALSLSSYLRRLAPRLLVYLSLHSYAQQVAAPYGLGYERPRNYQELMEVSNKTAEAISQRYGTPYSTGTIFDAIYPAAGSSVDWVKSSLGTRFVFLMELRDQGQLGFLLPPELILPTAQETTDGIVTMMQEVRRRIAADRDAAK